MGKGDGWELRALHSTAREGVQGELEIWRLRWGLEVSHRPYQRSFGLGKCRCQRFAAHPKHADLMDAFHEVRAERLRSPR